MTEAHEKVAIVLAAGKGTRMKSDLPKVLHKVAGRSLVSWAVQAALDGGAGQCVVVVGHGRDAVEANLKARFADRVRFVVQEQQNGTGHAVRCALDAALPDFGGQILVTYGDCPLVRGDSLKALFDASEGHEVGLFVATLDDPTGYGRMVRANYPESTGAVQRIVEHKDASEGERALTEVNPGLYCFDAAFLKQGIQNLDTDNAQGELYLTDLVSMAETVRDLPGEMAELRGVNDKLQLAECEASMRRRIVRGLAKNGVSIPDLDTVFVEADCEVEAGATLNPGVHLRGATKVASGAVVDSGSVLTDTTVCEGATVLPYTVATESLVGPGATVGPFAHLRPGTRLGEGSKVGNFSETKNTRLGKGSKVNHLAYVGDGDIGEGVNIGAGVIFCNYDGVQKHTTTLEDGVFIGSDSQLVAPVTVGKGAYVASGSTVTRDVPADALALSRTKQENKAGYAARLRARMVAKKAKSK